MRKPDPIKPYWYANSFILERYFKNKRIVFVGPAAYLEGKGLGKWIDGHDFVIRANRSRPIPDDYGSRTDILFNFITELWADYFIHEKPFLQDGVQLILTTTALPDYYQLFRSKIQTPAYVLPRKDYHRIKADIGSKPNTGTVAIAYLLSFPIKSLDVVGVDLYASGYCKGYGGDLNPGSHNFDAQAIYLDSLQIDDRLHLDKVMKDRITMAQAFKDEPITKKLPKMSIVIPYGYCNEYRDAVMNWTVARYKRLFPECQICIGRNEDKPFNRAKAKNDGIIQAKHDLIMIVDNDALFNRSLVHEALEIMKERGQNWVRAGGRSYRIDEKSSKAMIENDGDLDMTLKTEGLYSTNFFCIVKKDLLKNFDGFDENFKDWGGEDYAFYKSLSIWEKEGKRTTGEIWHIWHPLSLTGLKHMEALKNGDTSVPTAKRHIEYSNAKTKSDIFQIRRTAE